MIKRNKSKIKAALKKMLEEEASEKLENPKKLTKKEKAEIRRKIRQKNSTSVNVSWNIKLGDLVLFKYRDDTNIGLVIKQAADGKYRSLNASNRHGGVLVMSPVGRLWLNPKQLENLS